MIVVSYLMKRKIKKIFHEEISNTKIFNIKFCLIKLSITKILINLQGTRQIGTGQLRIRFTDLEKHEG